MKHSVMIKEDVRSSEITPEHVFLNRRDFLGKSVALVSGSLAMLHCLDWQVFKKMTKLRQKNCDFVQQFL